MANKVQKRWGLVALALSTILSAPFAEAAIPGFAGDSFALTVKSNFVSTPDGGVTYMWLYQISGGAFPQYPGPTLIVDRNTSAAVSVNLTNALTGPGQMPVSFTAPGLNVHCTAGDCMDDDAVSPGASGTYAFIPKRPGTFHYYSDHRTDVGVAMGLVGAIIVRPPNFAHVDEPNAQVPTSGATQKAYFNPATTSYDHEYLILSTDVDVDYHQIVRGVGQQDWETVGTPGSAERIAALTDALRNVQQTTPGGRVIKGFFPEYWFINGRAAFDNHQGINLPWLPTQPYNSVAQLHPGQTALLRFVGAGRQIHPFHPHGDETVILGVDGRQAHDGTAPGAAPNLSWREYTNDQIPGQTIDATWNWMPKGLGFDVYGNTLAAYAGVSCTPGDPEEVFEPFLDDPLYIVDVADRGVPLPTSQPPLSDLTFGGFWSGSAFLGKFGALPPGEGGLNANAGLAFIWHSHREKELINKDVFPGGLLSTMFVEPFEGPDGTVTIPRGSCFDNSNGAGC